MINVLICGICGETGKRVYLTAKKYENINVVCGVDKHFNSNIEFDCSVYTDFDQVSEIVDVIIDFSGPDALPSMIEFAKENNCAIVEGTTGYTQKQKDLITETGKDLPIFMPINVSPGINVLRKLCILASETLRSFDIEIIEEHQASKFNAPSMTSKMLADAINSVFDGNKKITSGRRGTGERVENEICIHSVRGGNLSGKTKIMFIGERETITISHEVHHRTLFAQGACDVALYIANKPAGIYNMDDFFKE